MIKLADISTRAPEGLEKASSVKERKKLAQRIGELQHLLYAEAKHSLLVVFQGMDASGKDGTTKKIFRNCSPSGTWAYGFKKPTDLEFAHDFLWRCHKLAPKKGHIQVFNRSHYEDVLIQRVHKWITEEHALKRIAAINAFENLLQFDNGTTIVKFYMHISPERQLEKLQERIDDPTKNWKHNPGDWEERKHWDEYMRCYEDAINRSEIPWTIVPADQRWYRDLFVARHMVKVLEALNMQLPELPQ
ncbi:MAG: polyphosphate kinase [Saprospiraceae bacterium]|nr:polyphosphate kinase [Saprospiraceae bacterium]